MKQSAIQIGDKKTLKRPTFLHNGIFVLQDSSVEVKALGETFVVEWHDKEGNPHLLKGIQLDELE